MGMKTTKGGSLLNQNSSSIHKCSWSEQDRKALVALFALLLEMELDQKNNVVKEYASAK
jgi:hypothetical protein